MGMGICHLHAAAAEWKIGQVIIDDMFVRLFGLLLIATGLVAHRITPWVINLGEIC